MLVLFLALQSPEEYRYYDSIGVYRKISYNVSHFKMTADYSLLKFVHQY